MTEQPGATPAGNESAATAGGENETNEDLEAQRLLAEAVAKPEDEPLGEGGKKALQAERDARKAAEKAAADAAAKVKEFEDRDKSELEKAQGRAQELEQKAAAAEREALRYRIASAHSISDEDAGVFLTGQDEETLTKQAERLAALRGEAAPRAPKPDPTQGARGGGVDLDAQIAEAQSKGDWRTVISLQNQKLAKQATNQ